MKKWTKKALFTMLLLIFGLTNVKAETVKWSAVKLGTNNINVYKKYVDKNGKSVVDGNMAYISVDNKTVFCVELDVDIFSDLTKGVATTSYVKPLETYFTKNADKTVKVNGQDINVIDAITIIAKEGKRLYSDTSLSDTKRKKWYITAQAMIWEYLAEAGVNGSIKSGEKIKLINAASKDVVSSSGTEINVSTYRTKLEKKVTEYFEAPSFSNYTDEKPFTYEAQEGKIEIKDENEVLENYKISTDTEGVTCSNNKNTLVCSYDPASPTPPQTINVKFEKTNTEINQIFKTGTNYQATLLANSDPKISYSTVIKLDVPKKNIKIIKKDKDGNTLSGVTFGIYSDSDAKTLIKKYTTNSKGIITVKDIDPTTEPTTYYIKELETVEGYVLNSDITKIDLSDTTSTNFDSNGITYTITLTNEKIVINGNIKIIKLDKETKKPLEGVTFEIYDEDDKIVETLKTNSEGTCTSKSLPVGTYYIKEKETLKDYLPYESSEEITISENKTYEITLVNEKVVPTGDSKILLLITIAICTLISAIIMYMKKINLVKSNTH